MWFYDTYQIYEDYNREFSNSSPCPPEKKGGKMLFCWEIGMRVGIETYTINRMIKCVYDGHVVV